MPELSIIVPAYNEAENLPVLYERILQVMNGLECPWEWIIIDDHSTDPTFAVARDIARRDPRVRAIRFARNHGSQLAIACGLQHAQGDCAVVLAADLQDPPELISELLAPRRRGAQVVWAVRRQREGEKASTIGFSRLYYFMMRHFVGIKQMPPTGADFVLMDRRVVDAFCQFRESNISIMALITWMGFRQVSIDYDKKARLHGRSGWSFEKKLKLVVDSVTSFSFLPIRLMSYAGFTITLLGFIYALVVIRHALAGSTAQGWASLMVVVLVIGGFQMLMMGVLGEYLWRALDEGRRRPRFLIEDTYQAQPVVDADSPGRERPGVPLGGVPSGTTMADLRERQATARDPVGAPTVLRRGRDGAGAVSKY